ncbi:hypothetical protein [Pseudomonas purpurea]
MPIWLKAPRYDRLWLIVFIPESLKGIDLADSKKPAEAGFLLKACD